MDGLDIKSGQIDVLNNPYIRYVGLGLSNGATTGWGTAYEEKYEFEFCDDEHKGKVLQAN